jgi:hypothetical protein
MGVKSQYHERKRKLVEAEMTILKRIVPVGGYSGAIDYMNSRFFRAGSEYTVTEQWMRHFLVRHGVLSPFKRGQHGLPKKTKQG